jgi:DnaK suppressor protein
MSARERQAARNTRAAAGPARGPVWRALLEAQWRARLQEVTELSLAYHEAAAAGPAGPPGDRKLRQLLRRAVAARRELADTDEALGRLASGRYGLCEGCAAAIPAWLLTVTPDTRYCPRCRPRPIRATRAAPALAAPRWRAAPH